MAGSRPDRGSTTGRQDADPAERPAEPELIEAAYRVTPASIEQAVERTGAKYVADLQAVVDRVGARYAARLAEKGDALAAKEATLVHARP